MKFILTSKNGIGGSSIILINTTTQPKNTEILLKGVEYLSNKTISYIREGWLVTEMRF